MATVGTWVDIPASTTTIVLLPQNLQRKFFSVFNNSLSECYLNYGTDGSTFRWTVKLKPGDYFETPLPVCLDRIEACWKVADGSAKVTEFI